MLSNIFPTGNNKNSINIASSSTLDDPFYRYKMPKIILKHEGKGNGVKTVLKNLKEVSKSLSRDVNDLLQYIASELSVCSLQRSDDFIVNGTFKEDIIQDIIYRFICSHVLCDVCENPETTLVTITSKKKKDTDTPIYKICAACGNKSQVKKHKINKRI